MFRISINKFLVLPIVCPISNSNSEEEEERRKEGIMIEATKRKSIPYLYGENV